MPVSKTSMRLVLSMKSPCSYTTIRNLSHITRYSQPRRLLSTMATAFKMNVSPTETGLLGWKQSEAASKKVTELLQKDMESFHVFFNAKGFHNHIPHHLLTVYGAGGDAAALEHAFKQNTSYQLKAKAPHTQVLDELRSDYATAGPKYFSKGKHYPDFLRFYQEQIDKCGSEDVLKEYVFKGEALADELFSRLFAGLLHPLIQLMFGLEWNQPAIIAEALAQAAVHNHRFGDYLFKVEAAAKHGNNKQKRPLVETCEALTKNDAVVKSVQYADHSAGGSVVLDVLAVKAKDEALELLSSIHVEPDQIDEKTAEMIHTAAYICASAAFWPTYEPKFDFNLIHLLTSSPAFISFSKLSWLPNETKARLLEWKIRVDAALYLAQGSPELTTDRFKAYTPRDIRQKKATNMISKPEDLFPRIFKAEDDGHNIKFARALLLAQKISQKYVDAPTRPTWLRIVDDDAWLRIHYAMLDSIEPYPAGEQHLRPAGFAETWKTMPKL